LLKTSLSFSLVVETSKNLFNSRAEGSSSSNAAQEFWMRAIEKAVAGFLHSAGMKMYYLLKTLAQNARNIPATS
jgi:hypothetical protein